MPDEIETLSDWNARLDACGCCEMPACPAPILEAESLDGSRTVSAFAPYTYDPDNESGGDVPNLYLAETFEFEYSDVGESEESETRNWRIYVDGEESSVNSSSVINREFSDESQAPPTGNHYIPQRTIPPLYDKDERSSPFGCDVDKGDCNDTGSVTTNIFTSEFTFEETDRNGNTTNESEDHSRTHTYQSDGNGGCELDSALGASGELPTKTLEHQPATGSTVVVDLDSTTDTIKIEGSTVTESGSGSEAVPSGWYGSWYLNSGTNSGSFTRVTTTRRTWTLSEDFTKSDSIADGEAFLNEAWDDIIVGGGSYDGDCSLLVFSSGSDALAEKSTSWPQQGDGMTGGDSLQYSFLEKRFRYRFTVPASHAGTYYKIEWDEVFFPEGWGEPGGIAPTVTPKSWEWTGGDKVGDWSLEVKVPEGELGTVELRNIRFLCARTPWGEKPETMGETYEP